MCVCRHLGLANGAFFSVDVARHYILIREGYDAFCRIEAMRCRAGQGKARRPGGEEAFFPSEASTGRRGTLAEEGGWNSRKKQQVALGCSWLHRSRHYGMVAGAGTGRLGGRTRWFRNL